MAFIFRRRILIGFLVLALLSAACSGQAAIEVEPTDDPQVMAGMQLFQLHCASCHAADGEAVIVGPSLAGVAARAGERITGIDARLYLQLSILQPETFLVEGFENLMPSTLGKQLTGEEVDALVAYLLTLE